MSFPQRAFFPLCILPAVIVLIALSPALRAGSETPPAGPAWERDILKAHRTAIDAGKPIFVYFTKTY